jgi:hypothetical protein
MRPTSGQLWPRVKAGFDARVEGGDVGVGFNRANFTGDVALTIDGDELNVDVQGGGGGSSFPNSAPPSPSAYDDEFTGGVLNAKWTEISDPTATGFVKTFAKYDTWLTLPNPGAAAANSWLFQQAMSGFEAGEPFDMTFRLANRIGTNGGTSDRVLVALGDNVTPGVGNLVNIGLAQSGGGLVIEVWNGGGFDVQMALGNPAASSVYFHFMRTAANLTRLWVSLDGFSWRMVFEGTRAWNFTYLQVHLIGHTAVANPSEPMIDFVRVQDARFVMPTP